MITLASDYKFYEGWCIHSDTNNKSFLRYCALLKEQGIKNWMWPLVLLDKRLINVNPHDPELSLEDRVLIIKECRRNPMYFIRECLMIPMSGGKLSHFLANPSNMASLWTFLNNINQFYMQPRQTGKTITLFAIMTTCLNIIHRGCTELLVTKDNKLRKKNIADIKKMRDAMPAYLNPYDESIDSNNQEEITVKFYKNHMMSAVGSRDDATANNIGRGHSLVFIGFDEPPFTSGIHIAMPAAIAAGNRARIDAKKLGMNSSYMLTTTAGERDRLEGRYCYDMQQGACQFTEHLFDMPNRKTLYDAVRAASRGRKLMLNIEYTHLQLGLTNEWIYDAIQETGLTDIDAINRDFFNKWSTGKLASPLTKAQREMIDKSLMEPCSVELTKSNYMMNWYVPDPRTAIANDMHTIGVDTSDAIGKDDISYVFTNARTGDTTGVVYFNEASIPDAAKWLADLMIQYKNTLLVIEAKSSARTFIDIVTFVLLENGEDPFKRMYNNVVQNAKDSRKDDFNRIRGRINDVNFYLPFKRDFGLSTSGSSRNVIYGSVLAKVANHGRVVKDKKMIDQFMGLVKRNGRIDHIASGNDDLVFSKLLSMYPLIEGHNLSYYGLDTTKVLSDMPVGNSDRELTQEEIAEENKRAAVSRRIASIEERMSDKYISEHQQRLLLGELQTLKMRWGFTDEQVNMYDQLFERVQEVMTKRKQTGGLRWRVG